MARERGAYVVFGGIHATLFPEEAFEHGGAQTVVKGDGDEVWPMLLDAIEGEPPSGSTKADAWMRIDSAQRAGTYCQPTAI
ncbi:MAG: hypothetical protein R2724_03700 [Bryobacterales bacterium]